MPRYFLSLIILSLIACCIEVDISVPSFPDMGHYFNVSESIIQMTIAYNFLGFCLGALVYGPLSDSYGRRPIMLWGNGILLIGAMGCVLAPSIPFLLTARFIQGIGAATSAVVAFAMVIDAYPEKGKSAALLGIMNAVITSLMALAPIVGGFINEAVGWRGNYGIVAVICLLSWVFMVSVLPETKKTKDPFQPTQIKKDYIKLLTSFTFISASLVPSLLYACYLSFITQASFLYTETFQLTIMEYVLHQAIILVTFCMVSLMSGRITQKLGARFTVITGMCISIFASISMAVVSIAAPTSPYLLTLFMTITCLGSAIYYPITFAASLEIFPKIKGTASSVIMSMRSVICFASVGLTGLLYNGDPSRIAFLLLGILLVSVAFTFVILKTAQFSRQS
jgi:DHA1 family bicyclomycin/chloramphenicol resistance-like MFS transporter